MAVDVKTPYQLSLQGVDTTGATSLANATTLGSLKQQSALQTAQTDANKAFNSYQTAMSQSISLQARQIGGGVSYDGGTGGNYIANFAGSGNVNQQARQTAISAAAKYIGTPYSWGGGSLSGPSKGIGRGANTVGFDCSGLVRYAFAQAGISMPRHSSAQFATGKRTSVNNLRPGDLIGRPGHIVIYAGNGMILEAPSTGKTVRLISMKSRGISDSKGWFGIRVKFQGE